MEKLGVSVRVTVGPMYRSSRKASNDHPVCSCHPAYFSKSPADEDYTKAIIHQFHRFGSRSRFHRGHACMPPILVQNGRFGGRQSSGFHPQRRYFKLKTPTSGDPRLFQFLQCCYAGRFRSVWGGWEHWKVALAICRMIPSECDASESLSVTEWDLSHIIRILPAEPRPPINRRVALGSAFNWVSHLPYQDHGILLSTCWGSDHRSNIAPSTVLLLK